MTIELHKSALSAVRSALQDLVLLDDLDQLQALLAGAGWRGESLGLEQVGALAQAAPALLDVLDQLDEALQRDKLTLGDLARALTNIGPVVAQVARAIAGLQLLASVPPEVPGIIAEDLLGSLLVRQLASSQRWLTLVLRFLGFLRVTARPALLRADGAVLRDAGEHARFDFHALGDALKDPVRYLRDEILRTSDGQWRAATAVADAVGPLLAEALDGAFARLAYGTLPAAVTSPLTPAEAAAASHLLFVEWVAPDDLDAARVRLILGPTDEYLAAEGPGLLLVTNGTLGRTLSTDASEVAVALTASSGPVVVTGKAAHAGGPGASGPQLEARAQLRLRNVDGSDCIRIGAADGLHMGIREVLLQVEIDLADPLDVKAAVALEGVQLVIEAGEFDGFLQQVLPKEPLRASGSLALEASLRTGLRAKGSLGGEYRIAGPVELGPLRLDEAVITGHVADDGLQLAAATSATLQLGPLTATVQRMGLSAKLGTPKASGDLAVGSLGGLDLLLGVKPPTGVELALDTDVVSGSGFLNLNYDIQQYSGEFAVSIENTVDVSVIGILNARLPSGQSGYSLLLVVTGQIPPIALGMGFTLNGVGGLLGINRTAAIDVLRGGLRNGTVDAILFPSDPLANVPALLNTLSSVFPVAEGRYVFGPMVRIGWGSPTILTFDLAILLELPEPVRIVLLGRILATLPDPDDPIVVLHMDAVGMLDFQRREFSLDASLYDSHILKFVLSGDMAMRLNWSDEPGFLLSVGGFHPHFQPPAEMPKLQRMSIVFLDTKDAKLRLESYFAVSSNTVQFGARADAFLSIGIVEAKGFLSFDALFHFNPFSLEAQLAAGVAISTADVVLLAADLELTLTGPTPWHLFGQAHFEVLGIQATVPVDLRIGDDDPPPAELPAPVDVYGLLQKSLADPRNWQTLSTPVADSPVRLQAPPSNDTAAKAPLLVHPLGTVSVRQRVVPLEVRIGRFGNAPMGGPAYFVVDTPSVAAPAIGQPDIALEASALKEQFAPAQFNNLTDSQRLSAPAFTLERAGLQIGTMAFATAATLSLAPDDEFEDLPPAGEGLAALQRTKHVERLISLGAAARAGLRTHGAKRYFAATTV